MNDSYRNKLIQWYQKKHRKLPWRETKDPYPIWISEIMLQQTRASAVIPFYESFMKRFPSIETLAKADESEVLEQWAGLGYYSRARNIHRAAKILASGSFPKTFLELKQLPGIGDYTSRAISSFAFSEKVGVLDGNVIRFLSRFHFLPLEYWRSPEKESFQSLSDQWSAKSPHLVNQALMEIGASICTPTNPHCQLCPLSEHCLAYEYKSQQALPLPKEKRKPEEWNFHFYLLRNNETIALTKNHNLPILKQQYMLPAQATPVEGKFVTKKQTINFYHSVTHHKILVSFTSLDESNLKVREFIEQKKDIFQNLVWVQISEVKKWCQSSIVSKVLERAF